MGNTFQEVPRGEQGNIGVRIKPDMPPGLFKVRGYFFYDSTFIISWITQFSPELSHILSLDIFQMDEVRSNNVVSPVWLPCV